ncbi:MAG: alpha/beta hydrolase [Rhodoferax sp.]|nr:alpha/beta hydrolase [Rhodoferax sp.]
MIETFLAELPHGITLSCRASGERGRPVLMFLHGFPEAAFVWDGLLEHFSQPAHGGYRCIAPNLRGFWPSSAPPEVEAYRAKHLAQDIGALIQLETDAPLAALVAHDWGGAVAWFLANRSPALMQRLVIVNSPHPGTFLRELQTSPAQQAASAYMNFLIRPDAEAWLAEDDFRRMWGFFATHGAAPGWLTEAVKDQYRAVWRHGLTGALNYYRASPMRPARPGDPACDAVQLPPSVLTADLPTLVVWGLDDIALPPALVDGLEAYVPRLTLNPVAGASHWIVHERPAELASWVGDFLRGDQD